jgi:hypothetical protein
MNSINLFPVEEKQTLRAEKLKVTFAFGSYSSYLTIADRDKELTVYLDQKLVMDQILNNINNLSSSYSRDKEYLLKLFKKSVEKLDQMDNETKDEMAAYLVQNLNTSEVKN